MTYNSDLLKWAQVKDQWSLYETALETCRTIFVSGKPGVGKTATPLFKFGERCLSVTLDGDMCTQETRGSYMPEGNVFKWTDAVGIQAARQGKILILNEVQRASQAVQDSLLGLADSIESAKIALPSGEVVTPHKDFKIIATSNDSIESLDPALQSRFDAVLHFDEPHPAIVGRLNQAHAKLGDAVFQSYKSPNPVNPRKGFAIATMLAQGVDKKIALLLALGPQQAQDFLAAWTLVK